MKPERYKSLRYFLLSRNVVSAENCWTGRVRSWRNLVTPGCSSDALLIRQADRTVSTDTWDGVRQEPLTNTGTRFSRSLSNRSLLRRRLLAGPRLWQTKIFIGRLMVGTRPMEISGAWGPGRPGADADHGSQYVANCFNTRCRSQSTTNPASPGECCVEQCNVR